jgi:GMP synthase (glutamine-hydrolysing)
MKQSVRIQVLQHVEFEGPACIQQWAAEQNYPVKICHLYKNEALPEIDSFDLLVVMGGPMGVYDESEYAWMSPEKALLKQAITEGKSVIGVCLGAQLIADVLGAKVYPNTEKEIGWWPVKHSKGAQDNLFGKLFAKEQTVFQWHGDTFDLPEGATLILSSDVCPNQAFVFANRVLALQFHLEVLPESIETFTRMCAHELVNAPYIQTTQEMLQPNAAMKSNQQLLYTILDELIKSI